MLDLLILVLAMSLLPLGVIRYVGHKTGHRMTVWKQVLCVLLFEFSFAPYASVLFLARADTGLISWIYFLLVWMFFYIARFLLPARISIIAPILFGLMLMYPAWSFITISEGHLAFSYGSSRVIDLARGSNKVLDFIHDLSNIAWAVLPLVGTHYLLKSIEKG